MSDRSARANDIIGSVVITGDGNHVYATFGDSGVVLSLWRPQFPPPRRGIAPPRELDLLLPDPDLLPLLGRDSLLKELRAWLDAPDDLAVRALTGRAGSGKTRLAIELCRAIDTDPTGKGAWLTGFLTADRLGPVIDRLETAACAWARPTLLVLDDAATGAPALGRWLDVLARVTQPQKLRFLLLEREASAEIGWWHDLTQPAADASRVRRELFEGRPPVVLPDLTEPAQRRTLVAAAFASARELRPGVPEDRAVPAAGVDAAFDQALARQHFGNPLALVMAGVLMRDMTPIQALGLRHLEAAGRLAAREIERLEALGRARGLAAPVVRHALALNGLAGGLLRADLRATLAGALLALSQAADIDALLALMTEEFPPSVDPDAEAPAPAAPDRLRTIRPNLIGEAAVLRAVSGTLDADAPGIARRAYGLGGANAATALVALAQDFGYARHDPGALAAERADAERVLAWLNHIATTVTDAESLLPLYNALPVQTLVLRDLAAELSERLLATLGTGDQSPERAPLLSNLSKRRSDLGRREAALAAIEEAVAIYRDLVAAHPDAFRPVLAASLNNLSNRRSDLGRREAALAAIEEAVAIRRDLAAARPNAFRPDLATSLNNLSVQLANLGRREAALAAIEEAVAIYRDLAATRPDAFRPVLAGSLNNLSNRLSGLGRREAALAAIEEAVAIYRDLAAARPDAFRPDLALSLNNLSNCLSDLGRREAALAAIDEAVAIRRDLAAARPDAFRPDLAMSLNNLSVQLANLGRREAALAAIEEAVAIRRDLAAARPDAFRPDLAMSLNNLSNRLFDLGRREAALAAIDEAVAIYRDLAAARPDAFRPVLALSLWVRANRLDETGDRQGGLAANAEAIRTLADPFLRLPDAHARRMAGMVREYLQRAEALGQTPDDALLAPIEAVLSGLQDGTE